MKLVVRLILLVCLLAPMLSAGHVYADDGDPLEGLTDTEKAYVNKLKGAYAEARESLGRVKGTLGAEALGALFGAEASPTEVAGALMTCSGELNALAKVFTEAPPPDMADLATVNQNVAAVLTTAFQPCVALTVDEGVQHVLNAGRNLLSGLLGAAPEPDKEQPSFKARMITCVTNEIGTIEGTLASGEAALDAVVADIKLSQQTGEDFLEALLSGECFIATAAYGTRSAAQIDVLRDFRDEVLMMSPAGRDLVGFYYAASPPLADFIARHEVLRCFVREGLVDPVVWVVEMLEPVWQS